MSSLSLRAARDADLAAIHEIYEHYVRSSTCTYQLDVSDLDATRAWYREHAPPTHPVLIAELDGGVVGWGALSRYRERAGYHHTVEDSVYVDHRHHGRGIGRALLAQLVSLAQEIGHHTILAGIDADQSASVRLHERAGFTQVGRVSEVGFKFGRWLDVIWMQLLLR